MRDKLVAGARSADCVKTALKSFFCQHVPPHERIAHKFAVLGIHKPFGDGKHGRFFGNRRQDFFAEPIHAEAGNAADDEVGTLKRLLHFLDLVVLYAFGKVLGKLGVTSGFTADVDDFAVKMSAYKPYLMAVFPCGKRKRRAHHSRTYNCNDAHFFILLAS